MTKSVIFKRGNLYLSHFYKWVHIPDLFPKWQVPSVLELMQGWKKDQAEYMAEVDEHAVIDLDALEYVKL